MVYRNTIYKVHFTSYFYDIFNVNKIVYSFTIPLTYKQFMQFTLSSFVQDSNGYELIIPNSC